VWISHHLRVVAAEDRRRLAVGLANRTSYRLVEPLEAKALEVVGCEHENASARRGGWHLFLSMVATDLDTEQGGTDADKRDGARQLGRLNLTDMQL